MKKVIMACFIIATSGAMCRHPSVSIPAGFIKSNIPEAGSDPWLILNHCSHEYGVMIKDGKLQVEEVREKDTCEYKIPEGTLVAIDEGEFGGQLTFHPADYPDSVIQVKAGNVRHIFSFEGRTYFLEGLAHGDISRGALYRLNAVGNKVTYSQVLDLHDAPQAFAIDGATIMIATYENFYIVQDFQKKLIFEKTFWASLFPNSIAVENDSSVLIGMRGGIAKLNLSSKRIEFYQSNQCLVRADTVSSEMIVKSVELDDIIDRGSKPDERFLHAWNQLKDAARKGDRKRLLDLCCDSLYYKGTLLSAHDFYAKGFDTLVFHPLAEKKLPPFEYHGSIVIGKYMNSFFKIRNDGNGPCVRIKGMSTPLQNTHEPAEYTYYDFAETKKGYKLYRVGITIPD